MNRMDSRDIGDEIEYGREKAMGNGDKMAKVFRAFARVHTWSTEHAILSKNEN